MKSSEYELYLLKNLINDLDKNKNENNNFSNCQKIFSDFKYNNLAKPQENKSNLEVNKDSSKNSTCSSNNNSFNLYTKSDILNLLKNKKSSILLQNEIKSFSEYEIEHIVYELKGSFIYLLQDKNGNYFSSDLFKLCSQELINSIILEIKKDILNLMLHNYANHSIQTLIECIKSEKNYILISDIFPNEKILFDIILNPNGNFIVQKFITNIPEKFRLEFNNLFLKIFNDLIFDMYGICSVKKFIYKTENEEMFKNFMQIIFMNFLEISRNKYGNYLIQFLLENYKNNFHINNLKNLIIKYFYDLSINQYSSHICDLYISELNPYEKKILLNFLISNGCYQKLLNNKYGTFVVKKLNINPYFFSNINK